MNIYTRKQRWKLLLLAAAMLIGVISLWYTNNLVNKLSEQEKKNVALWAEGIRQLSEISVEAGDISFALEVIRSNSNNPMILTDETGKINSWRNLERISNPS